MTFIIPNQQTKKIRQLNSGELAGELFVTKNIDLTKQGHIKLAHPSVTIMSTDNDADMNQVDSMFKGGSEIFVNSKYPFSGNIGLEVLASHKTDTNCPSPGVEEDGIFFNGKEVVTDGTQIFYHPTFNTWTAVSLSSVGMSSSFPSCLDVFVAFNSLLVGNGNKVFKVNSSWVVDTNPLVLPSDYNVTSICSNNNTVYIATRHISNGEAKLFLWDGTSASHNGSFGVGTYEISSCKKYKSSCALITSRGQLLQFNGGGFTELGNLPVYYSDRDWGNSLNDHDNISNRGMVVDVDKIYLRFDSEIQSAINAYNPYFVGGIWCYDPENGLYCINTPSFTKVSSYGFPTTNVNISTNVITVASAPITGTPLFFRPSAFGTIGGLVDRKIYYIIQVDSTHVKLASSLYNALNNIEIDLTSTGDTGQTLDYFLVNDYGFSYSSDRGAIEILTDTIGYLRDKNDKVVYTSKLQGKQATTIKYCVNSITPLLPNRGYFITPKLTSPNLEDNFNTVSIKYLPLKTDESIIIKYKNIDKLNIPFGAFDNRQTIDATWVDTNTFTTTLDMSNASVGDEVEIVRGVGAGCLLHIETLSNNAGTWTVNLTEPFIFASANDIMSFYVNNWTILDTITSANQNGQEFKNIPLDKSSKFVQLKVELRGVDVDIEELQITNEKLLKAR